MTHNGIIRNNHDDQPWLALKVRWNELPLLAMACWNEPPSGATSPTSPSGRGLILCVYIYIPSGKLT